MTTGAVPVTRARKRFHGVHCTVGRSLRCVVLGYTTRDEQIRVAAMPAYVAMAAAEWGRTIRRGGDQRQGGW
ncbi:hypothetical protein GCM10010483_40310 [Actinokineospora diospyrosa]